MKNKTNYGFTLLEILLVVGIISVLAGIVIVAINPGKMLAKARDTQRKVAVTELNKALAQYYIDKSFFPETLTNELRGICLTGDSSSSTEDGIDCTTDDLVDLSVLVPVYLPSIPVDPRGGGYHVGKNSSGKVVVTAPQTESGLPIIAVGNLDPEIVIDPCEAGTAPIGSVCEGGALYGGTFNTYKYMVIPNDLGMYVWDNSCVQDEWTYMWSCSAIVANNYSYGKPNIDAMKIISPDLSIYPAAQACEALNVGTGYGGYTDWYLPAEYELEYLWRNGNTYCTDYNWGSGVCNNPLPSLPYIGGFNGTNNFGIAAYWPSTNSGGEYAGNVLFNNGGGHVNNMKYVSHSVRCVRRY